MNTLEIETFIGFLLQFTTCVNGTKGMGKEKSLQDILKHHGGDFLKCLITVTNYATLKGINVTRLHDL